MLLLFSHVTCACLAFHQKAFCIVHYTTWLFSCVYL
jgi:hypothetical protein